MCIWVEAQVEVGRRNREFFPILFVKTSDFRPVFNFQQTHTADAWYNRSYTIMAKPTIALGFYYQIIQFLIISVSRRGKFRP